MQKVAGSSLTEADILRGSAFKFQIAQISTHLNEEDPVPRHEGTRVQEKREGKDQPRTEPIPVVCDPRRHVLAEALVALPDEVPLLRRVESYIYCMFILLRF